MRRRVPFWGLLFAGLLLASAAMADRALQMKSLLDALKIAETVEVMQQEGDIYGTSLVTSMGLETDAALWGRTVRRIYDAEKMQALIITEIESALSETDLAPLLAYYGSQDAARVVALELSARRVFLDPDTEALAIARSEGLRADGAPLMARIETLIADSDLIGRNVAGALNSELMFYRGLNDGGAFDLSEDEMLAAVWAREEELRASTRAWMEGFLSMAYQQLSSQQLEDYAALWRTPEGRDLNRAVFAGFDRMYEDISYLLGLAVAREMRGEKL